MPRLEDGGGASRTTDPASGSSTGTDVSLREYVFALRAADLAFHEERDRRYTEVAQEREKALKIKEEADKAALQLAREIQTYKDEKANELREQISQERGLYVSQGELKSALAEIQATLKPILDFVAGQRGERQGTFDQRQLVQWAAGLVLAGLTIYFAFN